MRNHELERKSEAEDLGLTVTDDLKWHKHITKICDRANREINRISRTFKTRTPRFLKDLYQTYVRPHLQYCSSVWNPVYVGDIQKIERVQNKFTRLLKHSSVMTPQQRNEFIGISTHQERRKRGELIELYKNLDNAKLFKRDSGRSSENRRQHSKTLMIRRKKNAVFPAPPLPRKTSPA